MVYSDKMYAKRYGNPTVMTDLDHVVFFTRK